MICINKSIVKKVNQYETIPEVVDYIINKLNPIKIILFGSCARGMITSHSDIDLCIVLEEKLGPKERSKLRANLLIGLLDITDFEIDLFICSKEEWEKRYSDHGTFIGKIYKEGKLLYGG